MPHAYTTVSGADGPGTAPTVIDAFRAALGAPHYADLVAQTGIDPGRVRSLADFERLVPIVRKGDLFRDEIPFERLCLGGRLGDVRSVMVSSGFGGRASFAVATAAELALGAQEVDAALDLLFGISRTPTLLIGALSMGVHVPTGIPLAETGPRSDSVLRLLQRFGSSFGQFLILADPHVLKEIVDEGHGAGIDWAGRRVNFIAGGDWMPQTLHAYIRTRTGIGEGDGRVLMQTMGVTELGLNILFESAATARLRDLAAADPGLRQRLFPGSGPAVPSLFHYDPRRFHLEGIPHPQGRELVFTALSPTRTVPMIRYASGDLGDVLPREALAERLTACGLGALLPTLPLPCAWVAGRPAAIRVGSGRLRVEDLRHGLYGDPIVAAAVTGHFTVVGPPGAESARVQLRRGLTPTEGLRAAAERALFAAVGTTLPTAVDGYAEYPFGKATDYERKFDHGQPGAEEGDAPTDGNAWIGRSVREERE